MPSACVSRSISENYNRLETNCMGAIVGIDVGGTFTDLFYVGDDRAHGILKVPSTPQDPSIGLLNALDAGGAPPGSLAAILRGTAIATNAIIEKRGAACALITTRGFGDLLELGRRDRPTMYGLTGTHTPLIERDRRYEVDERLDYEGNVLTPLDEAAVRAVAESLRDTAIEAVVISFMHAYANTAHEDRAREIVLAVNPDWEVVTATSVVREYYEFERTSTGVVQGYLQPLVARYARKLADWGFRRNVLVMQSNGGLAPLAELDRRAAHIVRSGPAAGVIAAAELVAAAGFPNIITGDMGGTSFDVAVVVAGKPTVVEFTTDGRTWRPDLGARQKKLHLHAGHGVEFRSPGGGGFSDPLTRDVEAVERDLDLRYVSRDTAEQTYGVVISDVVSVAGHARYRVDRNATADRRRSAQTETVGGLP